MPVRVSGQTQWPVSLENLYHKRAELIEELHDTQQAIASQELTMLVQGVPINGDTGTR